MVKYLKVIFAFLFIIMLNSCLDLKNKTYSFKNGRLSLVNSRDFFNKNYRAKFKVGLPELIDTRALYIESYYISGLNKEKFQRSDLWNGIYRFFNNGAMNDFSMDKRKSMLSSKNYNPDSTDKKGVCYNKDGIWFVDIFAKSSELNTAGIYRYEVISITKDTLKLK